MKYFIIFFITLIYCKNSLAWNHEDSLAYTQNKSHVFWDDIHSVKITQQNFELARPIIALNSNDVLNIAFDEINGVGEIYNYRLIYCNADWSTSELSYFDYIEGYNDLSIAFMQNSMSTKIPYVHYRIDFPNAQMRPKLSGNYLLRVYGDDPEDPAFQLRIYVVENLLTTTSTINYTRETGKYPTHHQIDVQVNVKNFSIADIATQCKLAIVQNNRQDRILQVNRPLYDDDLVLRYENNNQMLPAGNEFREFDIRVIKTLGRNIAHIESLTDGYEVQVQKDPVRTYGAYTNLTDINGQYVIGMYENISPDTDAEYCDVYFNLDLATPLPNGKIYVLGDFNFFETDPLYELKYDMRKNRYIGHALLKQGYYNYTYVFVPNNNSTTHDESMTEGNFKDTDNEYQIYFYYRDFNGRYDRIISYSNISSTWK